jgi:hypothetical protein
MPLFLIIQEVISILFISQESLCLPLTSEYGTAWNNLPNGNRTWYIMEGKKTFSLKNNP